MSLGCDEVHLHIFFLLFGSFRLSPNCFRAVELFISLPLQLQMSIDLPSVYRSSVTVYLGDSRFSSCNNSVVFSHESLTLQNRNIQDLLCASI